MHGGGIFTQLTAKNCFKQLKSQLTIASFGAYNYRLTESITVCNLVSSSASFGVKWPPRYNRVLEKFCLVFNFKLNDWFMLFYWLLTVIGFKRPPDNHLHRRFVTYFNKNKWPVIKPKLMPFTPDFKYFRGKVVHAGHTADLFLVFLSV